MKSTLRKVICIPTYTWYSSTAQIIVYWCIYEITEHKKTKRNHIFKLSFHFLLYKAFRDHLVFKCKQFPFFYDLELTGDKGSLKNKYQQKFEQRICQLNTISHIKASYQVIQPIIVSAINRPKRGLTYFFNASTGGAFQTTPKQNRCMIGDIAAMSTRCLANTFYEMS